MNNAVFSYTVYDNPQITEEQIEKAAMLCGGKDTVAWKREYLAQIVRDPSAMIVPNFNRDVHVCRVELPNYARWIVSIDWGGVRDKTVALLMGYDFLNNKILVIDERVFPKNTPTEEIVKGVRAMERRIDELYGHEIVGRWADAPGQLQIDLDKHHKYAIRVPKKDDWKAAINNMQVEFATDKVRIDEGCSFLTHSLESGRYNDNRTDFDRNETLGHCDALAALMYGCRMLDRAQPFQDIVPPQDQVFVRPRNEPDHPMAETLRPKVFHRQRGEKGVKRFGTFNK